jgi:hypothetical protein
VNQQALPLEKVVLAERSRTFASNHAVRCEEETFVLEFINDADEIQRTIHRAAGRPRSPSLPVPSSSTFSSAALKPSRASGLPRSRQAPPHAQAFKSGFSIARETSYDEFHSFTAPTSGEADNFRTIE